MPIYILMGLMIVVLVIFIFMKIKTSKKFDKVVSIITEDVQEQQPGQVIAGIKESEEVLKKKSQEIKMEADRIANEQAAIGTFLTDRGVVNKIENFKIGDDNTMS